MCSSTSIIDINDILTQKFSEELFTEFAINLVNLESKDLLNSIYFEEDNKTYEKYIDYVKDIGRYRDTDKNTIVLSIIKLKESPENARTMQRNFIAKHMGELDADASIVALYSEKTDIWRISFVKLDYTIDIDGIHQKLTPAKRYSYLIDPSLNNHTAQEQLSKLYYNDSQKATLLDIENVFSVEVVTDEFFKMYKEKYLDLKELLEKDNNFIAEAKALDIGINDFSEEFAKKLMGQISFLYFLQKKGWLGVKIVPKKISKVELREIYRRQDEEIRSIINKVYNSKNEFMVLSSLELKNLSNDDAEKLASSFKNTKYDEEWGTGTRQFIRTIFNTSKNNNFNFFNEYLEPLFYNALNKKRGNTEYYQLFNCKIPFLNGGLFEPIYKYDWKNTSIQIPNIFFSNEDNEGLLDLFDMYNFTINEDEPLEKEVAVDPEMLGKIFENLLEVKERKSKGAFYTPREIVHYMCQESLINYLGNETEIVHDDIEIFIKYGEIIRDSDMNTYKKENYKMPKTIVENFKKIDKALENVKIADPSVGSGAFSLGMLNEIVKARSIITDYIYINSDEVDVFDSRSIYKLKKNTMKKSIFAVDIEPSAVDITKLRLWLSLVVDADKKTVNTLPNLDYNIMVGNSLIEDFRGIKLFDEELLKEKPRVKKKKDNRQISMNIGKNNEINIGIEQEYQLLEDIQYLQSKLFDIKDTEVKKNIKKEIEDKEWELIEYKLNREKGLSFKEVQELKKQRSLHKKPYFLWKLEFSKVFKEKGGFDIVIGNPPYIDSETMLKNGMEAERNYISQNYKFTKGNWDIYIAFFEKGFSLLREGGNQIYITPDKWISKSFGDKLRISQIEYINQILVAGRDIFESAIVDSIITMFCKKISNSIKVFEMKNKKSPIKYVRTVPKSLLASPYTLDIIFSDSINLIQKISNIGDILGNNYPCENACATSDCYTLKNILYSLDKAEDFNPDIHYKVINTGTIGCYVDKWGISPMKYLKDKYLYPVVDKKSFHNIFKNTYGSKANKRKLIIKGLTLLDASLDLQGNVIPGKSTMIIPIENEEDLKIVSAFINSKISIFYIKQKYSSSSYNGGINFTKNMINNLPWAKLNTHDKNLILGFVDCIIKNNNDIENVSELKRKIDYIFYKNFNLTDKEIERIEAIN